MRRSRGGRVWAMVAVLALTAGACAEDGDRKGAGSSQAQVTLLETTTTTTATTLRPTTTSRPTTTTAPDRTHASAKAQSVEDFWKRSATGPEILRGTFGTWEWRLYDRVDNCMDLAARGPAGEGGGSSGDCELDLPLGVGRAFYGNGAYEGRFGVVAPHAKHVDLVLADGTRLGFKLSGVLEGCGCKKIAMLRRPAPAGDRVIAYAEDGEPIATQKDSEVFGPPPQR